MSDPTVLTIFSIVFILLGFYSVNSGIKRMREAQRLGQPVRWYRQINMLVGIEYALLSLVFLLSLNIRNGTLPHALESIVLPFYLVLLLLSAILAGFVIRQAILNARRPRQSTSASANSTFIASNKATVDEALAPEQQQALNLQRQRARRQKAAAARRRRAGKA
jgi:glucan phosphoethanolaminetransferase (alkaline phosphatase superfamily)